MRYILNLRVTQDVALKRLTEVTVCPCLWDESTYVCPWLQIIIQNIMGMALNRLFFLN